MLIIAVVTNPGLILLSVIRQMHTVTNELKLEYTHHELFFPKAKRRITYGTVCLIEERRGQSANDSHDEHRACDGSTLSVKFQLLLPQGAAAHTCARH